MTSNEAADAVGLSDGGIGLHGAFDGLAGFGDRVLGSLSGNW